jgi:hypothetical protein
MKHLIPLTIALAMIAGISQSNAQQVIATGGGWYQTENITMSFTIGEPVIETFSGGDVILTQGFQQPYSFYLQQILNIPAGWSGVSTWLDPLNKSVDGLFAPAANDLIILASMDGFYYPAQSVNTLGNWNYLSGYQAKAENAFELTVSGTKIPSQALEITEGWNLMPVLSSCEADVEDLFAGFSGLQIVKEVAGTKIYWPAYNINTLENLLPGKAYFVASADVGTITFPACTKSSPLSLPQENPENTTPWNDLSYSAISHVVAFPAAVIQNSGILPDDIVGAFTPDGLCAGRLEIQNAISNTALNIFADDATTPEKDGFEAGDYFQLKVYRPATGQEMLLDIDFDPALPNMANFSPHGISAVQSLKLQPAGESEFADIKINIFPNPTTGIFNLIMNVWPEMTQIQLLDARGQTINTFKIENKPNGHSHAFDLSNLPKGVYFVKINGGGLVTVEKIVIN